MSLTLRQKAYQAICQKVLRGELLPGNRISEFAIAKQLGISRSPVREAISQLASEGLVTLIPEAGSFVRQFTPAEIDHVFQFREWLETRAIEEAMRRARPEDYLPLRACCDEILEVAREHRRSGEPHLGLPGYWRWLKADFSFHFGIVRLAGNPLVLRTVASQYFISNCLNGFFWQHTLSDLVLLYRQHRRILQAMCHGDAEEARRRIAEHTQRGRRHALDLLARRRAGEGLGPLAGEDHWLGALQGMVQELVSGDSGTTSS